MRSSFITSYSFGITFARINPPIDSCLGIHVCIRTLAPEGGKNQSPLYSSFLFFSVSITTTMHVCGLCACMYRYCRECMYASMYVRTYLFHHLPTFFFSLVSYSLASSSSLLFFLTCHLTLFSCREVPQATGGRISHLKINHRITQEVHHYHYLFRLLPQGDNDLCARFRLRPRQKPQNTRVLTLSSLVQ